MEVSLLSPSFLLSPYTHRQHTATQESSCLQQETHYTLKKERRVLIFQLPENKSLGSDLQHTLISSITKIKTLLWGTKTGGNTRGGSLICNPVYSLIYKKMCLTSCRTSSEWEEASLTNTHLFSMYVPGFSQRKCVSKSGYQLCYIFLWGFEWEAHDPVLSQSCASLWFYTRNDRNEN